MTGRPQGGISHWDAVERERRDVGPLCSTWRDLGAAAGATLAGVQRVEVDPGARSTPVHVHGAEEEIFYVLGGTGLAWLDGSVHEVAAGDAVVCVAGGPAHTFIAGDEGLDLLAFGTNVDVPLVRLPRAGVLRRGDFVVAEAGAPGPLEREAAAGDLAVPDPAPRPSCIVATAGVPVEDEPLPPGYEGAERDIGRLAGSRDTGLRHVVLQAGCLSCPPHWHSAEHELFVVLEGDGELVLHDNAGAVSSRTPVRAGSCVSRPGGTGEAHALRAGSGSMTYLAYGTRQPSEIVYYPRSRKAWLGQVMVRVEPVDDYWDGER